MIFVRKRDTSRHSTVSFSQSVVVAEMLEVLSFCDQERA